MNKEKTRPVSTRISLEEFAKVLDSLIAKGVPANKLMSNSAIVKTALLMTIISSAEPTAPASQESLDIVKQLWRVTKRDKKIDLNNLY